MSTTDPQSIGTQPPEPVGPVGAVKNFYGRYARFSGRASRSEYWWIALFSLLVAAALRWVFGALLDLTLDGMTGASGILGAVVVLGWVVSLIHFIPGLSLTARRLHDVDRSGWWVLLNLSWLISIVLFVPLLESTSDGVVLVAAILTVLFVLAGPLALLILTLLPSNARGVRFDRASDF